VVSKRDPVDSLSLGTFLPTLCFSVLSFWCVKPPLENPRVGSIARYRSCRSLLCHVIRPHISARPAHYLAEAVPEDEEDYPCISRGPVIRNQSLRVYVWCENGGSDI